MSDLQKQRASEANLTHGQSRTKEYVVYRAAKQRCRNPNQKQYKDYGGRGIEFRFTSIVDWVAELGPKPGPDYSVDRINNNGHYEPGNIRWATKVEQSRNARCPCANCLLMRGHDIDGKERASR